MRGSGRDNKAKIARRVFEVLEYFDDNAREATVMEIVRRYNRPQSSTSELLWILVELGILHKNPVTRSYSLTPRAAMIGMSGQPELIRNGALTTLVDRLAAQTGLSVGIFGMVGLKAQIISWRKNGLTPQGEPGFDFYGGMVDDLTASAAGWLLLSTLTQQRCKGVLHRLNAEAAVDAKFSLTDMSARIDLCRRDSFANGAAGFGSTAELCAVLLPGQPDNQPMAIGFVYEPCDQISSAALANCLRDGLQYYAGRDQRTPVPVLQQLSSAA